MGSCWWGEPPCCPWGSGDIQGTAGQGDGECRVARLVPVLGSAHTAEHGQAPAEGRETALAPRLEV